MKAVVLAAGKGTRLREMTDAVPKPMLEVGGTPMLWHVLSALRSAGVSEAALIVGYRADVIRDYFGETKELTLGKLNFMGWKKMTVAVPPTITQSEYHFGGKDGIVFEGLKIEFDLAETYGQYYIYFDDLRAWTDLFAEVARDDDSMSDDW